MSRAIWPAEFQIGRIRWLIKDILLGEVIMSYFSAGLKGAYLGKLVIWMHFVIGQWIWKVDWGLLRILMLRFGRCNLMKAIFNSNCDTGPESSKLPIHWRQENFLVEAFKKNNHGYLDPNQPQSIYLFERFTTVGFICQNVFQIGRLMSRNMCWGWNIEKVFIDLFRSRGGNIICLAVWPMPLVIMEGHSGRKYI